jgi:cytochrome P450
MVRPPFMNAPGPEPAQMLSSFLQIRKAAPEFLTTMRDQFGPIVQFPIPKPLTYLISDPNWVDYVLRTNSKNYGKATIQYRTLALVTGFGLLAADTPQWREQRKVVQPAFHHDVVTQVIEHSAQATQQVLNRLEAKYGEVVDLDHEMMQLALNVVGSALFGADFESRANNLITATLSGLDVVVSRARTPVFPPSWMPTPLNLKLNRANRTLTKAVDSLIDAAIKSSSSNSIVDLLVAELQAGNFSREQVRNELVTFIVAGHETVASALSWALCLLSENPTYQELIFNEVHQVLGERTPVFADYPNLPATKAVLDEAMRLYPPAWVLTRSTIADDEIAGVEIKAGSLIVISPWVVHRDPVAWPDANKFDPTRFLNQRKIEQGSFIPFGLGNRMCIGKDFALFEAVIALAMLVRSFKFEPTQANTEALPSVTVRPKSGLPLKFISRTAN